MNLITDRTPNDVARWRELHDKGWAAMTASERAEWLDQMKGRYNHTDMNRVENAVGVLSERLYSLGRLATRLVVKTNWTGSDSPTRADMERYFGNVGKLREEITVYASTPFAPTIDRRLDYAKANDLEQILIDVDEITTKISQSWYFAGDIYSGEV